MGLNSALVDRARVLRREPSEVKVEGRTSFAEVKYAWFRARLELRGTAQSRDDSGAPRATKQPTLMFGVKDLEGDDLDVRFTDRLEIDSPQLGRAVYEVNGSVSPMRKKRRVIGYEVALRRVDEAPFRRP